MSESTVVSAVEPEVKPVEVVNSVDAHTPEPPTHEAAAPDHAMAQMHELVSKLGAMVQTMTDAVSALADIAVSSRPDAAPGSVPWTHRGPGGSS